MDVASLQAFIAVAEAGSFSAAAEQLYLTQPAVSKRIAVLEDSLAARLFDRIGRRTTLTEAGRALLPRARRILAVANDADLQTPAGMAKRKMQRYGQGNTNQEQWIDLQC